MRSIMILSLLAVCVGMPVEMGAARAGQRRKLEALEKQQHQVEAPELEELIEEQEPALQHISKQSKQRSKNGDLGLLAEGARPFTLKERLELWKHRNQPDAEGLCYHALRGDLAGVLKFFTPNEGARARRYEHKKNRGLMMVKNVIDTPVLERKATPLMCAVAGGNLRVVQFFINNRSDTPLKNSLDGGGNSVLQYADLIRDKKKQKTVKDSLQSKPTQDSIPSPARDVNNTTFAEEPGYVHSFLHDLTSAENAFDPHPLNHGEGLYLYKKKKDLTAEGLCFQILYGSYEEFSARVQAIRYTIKNIEKNIEEILNTRVFSYVGGRGMTPLMCSVLSGKSKNVALLLNLIPKNYDVFQKDGFGDGFEAYLREINDVQEREAIKNLLESRSDIIKMGTESDSSSLNTSSEGDSTSSEHSRESSPTTPRTEVRPYSDPTNKGKGEVIE